MNETVVQGTPAWRLARLGKITASRFRDVLTEPRTNAAKLAGELSLTAQSYMLKVAAEILTGQSDDPEPTKAMQWGTEHEAEAREVYEAMMGVKVEEVGFLTHPLEPMIGGSPDGLVGTDGGIEIKCPYLTANHLAHRLGGGVPKEYLPQVKALLWITGRKWWDFVSYDPRIPDTRIALWTHRVEADQDLSNKLEEAVFGFRDKLLETLDLLKEGDK